MERFDESNLLRSIESLPNWKRVAFMAYCCERMLPNFRAFEADGGHGDGNVLREALDAIWDWVAMDTRPKNASMLESDCEHQFPDTSKYASKYTSAALDAASSVAITLEAITEATPKVVVEVASLSRDTIDLFVQQKEELDPNATDLEQIIITNELMQKELRIQRESLIQLDSMPGGREEVGNQLRASWSKLTQGSLPSP